MYNTTYFIFTFSTTFFLALDIENPVVIAATHILLHDVRQAFSVKSVSPCEGGFDPNSSPGGRIGNRNRKKRNRSEVGGDWVSDRRKESRFWLISVLEYREVSSIPNAFLILLMKKADVLRSRNTPGFCNTFVSRKSSKNVPNVVQTHKQTSPSIERDGFLVRCLEDQLDILDEVFDIVAAACIKQLSQGSRATRPILRRSILKLSLR